MKAKDYRKMPDEKLKALEKDLKLKMLMCGKKFIRPRDKPENIGKYRKEIARIKTILHARRLEKEKELIKRMKGGK